MTLEEVTKQLKEIVEKLEGSEDLTEEELKELEDKADELEQEKKSLMDKAEKRKTTLDKVKKGVIGTVVAEVKDEEERNMDNHENEITQKEYRKAFLKTLMGKELTESEKRAMTTSTAKGVPTQTAEKIVAAIRDVSPVIEDIDLYYGSGYLKVFVKSANGTATVAEEGATLTSQDFVLVPVELTPSRITEFMQISGALNDMSIDDFETKMVEDIASGLAKTIETKIYAVMNTVDVTLDGTITEANIFALYGSLKSGYAKKAKFHMNRATKAAVMAVSNKSKNDLFLNDTILGTPICETDCLNDGVIIYGNSRYIVGELSKDITIENDRVLNNDTYEWLGSAMFDCKMGLSAAFVKLAPSTVPAQE